MGLQPSATTWARYWNSSGLSLPIQKIGPKAHGYAVVTELNEGMHI